jgi:hypothetical protein
MSDEQVNPEGKLDRRVATVSLFLGLLALWGLWEIFAS